MRKRDRKEYMKAHGKVYYLKHKEQIKARSKAYRLEHPDQVKAYDKTYYLARSEQVKARNKTWHLAHPEYTKTYYLTHCEQQKEKTKTYKLAHPEKVKAWYLAHPDYDKVYRQTPKGKEVIRKRYATRKQLGFIPLNDWFDGSEGHHIDRERVIYIPQELHESIRHSVLRDRNMEAINREAFDYMAQNYATI